MTLLYVGSGLLVLVGLGLIWLMLRQKPGGSADLTVAVEQLVALAEAQLPGQSGAEKLEFVLGEIQRLQAAGELPRADTMLLRIMIEAAVKAMKLAKDGAGQA